MKIGVGVSTYNRASCLEKCLEGLSLNTDIENVVVSDDGSDDNNVSISRSMGFLTLSNENGGIARNKNRLLYCLMVLGKCDVAILLEDDVLITEKGWDIRWANLAKKYGCIYNMYEGKGEFLSSLLTAQLVAIDRKAFSITGYMDCRFKGYGYEHCEWQNRIVRNGFGGCVVDDTLYYRAFSDKTIKSLEAPSTANEEDLKRNFDLYKTVNRDRGFKLPFYKYTDCDKFISECLNTGL